MGVHGRSKHTCLSEYRVSITNIMNPSHVNIQDSQKYYLI